MHKQMIINKQTETNKKCESPTIHYVKNIATFNTVLKKHECFSLELIDI